MTIRFYDMGYFLRTITLGRITAITLAPLGIYIRKGEDSLTTCTHESIHWKQQEEMLFIFFYVAYFLEWLVKIFFYGKRAYVNLSFEREAYNNERNIIYPFTRHKFAWIKLIF